MDLIGDQSVQVLTASWQAASLLLAALLALLLAAKLMQAARPFAPVAAQQLAGPVVLCNAPDLVGVLLARCLPTRAPPDLSQRTRLLPPGILFPQ